MLSRSSGAVLPVAGHRLDRARTQEGRHRRGAQKEVGRRHNCKVRVEDVAGRTHRANNNRVAQRRTVAGPEAPGREAD